MSGDDLDPAGQWPLPPAWMWDCAECVRMYEAMRGMQAEIAGLVAEDPTVDRDFTDSIVGTQVRLSRHLADAHAGSLPDWDPACRACAEHRERLTRAERTPDLRAGAVMVADEHRARHLFAPPRTVGLM
jgi:erythromycin esterase-like protein